MKARVKWTAPMTFLGETEAGHRVVIDSAPEVGGRDLGPRPMELVLLGLGSCSAVDVVGILKKARQAVTNLWVEIDAERAPTVPKVFTRIRLHFVVEGHEVGEAQVERAVRLSAEKYCSVARMLAPTVEILHSHEIRPAPPAAHPGADAL